MINFQELFVGIILGFVQGENLEYDTPVSHQTWRLRFR